MIRFTQNLTVIVGRLTRDPEVNETKNGFAGNFSLATDESYLDSNKTRIERTEYHRVIIFNSDATYMRDHAKKGDYVIVQGRRQTRQWEKQGVKQYTPEILADIITPIKTPSKA
jgi:single-strand DNA-binding protein